MTWYPQEPPPPAVIWLYFIGAAIYGAIIMCLLFIALVLPAQARDGGRYAQSPLKPWFDSLKSKKGLCCSVADGTKLDDPEWEFNGTSYRVKINGDWFVVPEEAVITETNKVGYAMVWPIGTGAQMQIRCFLPGSAT